MLILIPFGHILGARALDMEMRREGVAALLLTSQPAQGLQAKGRTSEHKRMAATCYG